MLKAEITQTVKHTYLVDVDIDNHSAHLIKYLI